MTISDFLMLLSLIVAIVAIAAANNKKIWIYKFSRFEVWLFVLLSVLILWLIKYDVIISLGFPYRYFYCKNGDLSQDIALVLSLILLLYFVLVIKCRKRIPKKNKHKLFQYYKRLITSNIDLLLEYLYEYHNVDSKQTEAFLLPIVTDRNFINKATMTDKLVVAKYLIAYPSFNLMQESYGAIKYYTRLLLDIEDNQFVRELMSADSKLIVNTQEDISIIKEQSILVEIFKDATYTFPVGMLDKMSTLAITELIYSPVFGYDEKAFSRARSQLYVEHYLRFFFIVLCNFISRNERIVPTMLRSHYLLNHFSFFSLIPKEDDTDNVKKNKLKIMDEVQLHFNALFYYCDNNNLTTHVKNLLILNTRLYKTSIREKLQYEDIARIVRLYLKRKIEWVTIDFCFKDYLGGIIPQYKEYNAKMTGEVKTIDTQLEDRKVFIMNLIKTGDRK